MTIKSLRIVERTRTHHIITDHRNDKIGEIKARKLPKGFYEKLLSHPITAFGYRIEFGNDLKNLPNPKFEKHQVIKALDFWIEYWVYENKKDYILTGTVDKDFELTLKELIEVREAVLKEPSSTLYTRKKIKGPPLYTPKGNDFNFEITRNGVRKFYKYDRQENREITNMTEGEIGGFERETGIIFERKKQQSLKDQSSSSIEIGENILPGKYSAIDQFCYKVKTVSMEEYYKKTHINRNSVLDELERSLRMSGSIMIPSDWTTMGTTTEPGDIVTMDENMQWRPMRLRTEEPNGPDHLLHSNLHPGIPSASSTEEPIIIYQDMMGQIAGDIIHSDPNTFVTVPVRFLGLGNTMINTNIFLESNLILNLDSFSRHRIEIRPDSQNFLQIDGVRYHTVDLSISHDPRQPLNGGYIFRDLWVQEIEPTVDNMGERMRVDFLQANNNSPMRTNISLTVEINSVSYENLIHDIPWELEILGNNRVRITGTRDNIYEVVRAPIQINFFH